MAKLHSIAWLCATMMSFTASMPSVERRQGTRFNHPIAITGSTFTGGIQSTFEAATGEIIDKALMELAFPTWWHYDILRGLDYFREAGERPDPRLSEAVQILRDKQRDGLWILEGAYKGKTHVQMEEVGKPSKWITMIALRVLKWYDEEQ